MAFTLVTTQTILARNAGALYGVTLGSTTMSSLVTQVGTGVDAFLNTVYANSIGNYDTTAVATTLVTNLGITDATLKAQAIAIVVANLNGVAYTARGAVINNIISEFSKLSDTTWGPLATAFNTQVSNAEAYAAIPANTTNAAFSSTSSTVTGTTFTLTSAIDNIAGTAGDDIIIGDNATASAADQINGGSGTDTLKLYGTAAKGVLSNVEKVYLNAPTTSMSVTTDTAVTSLEVDALATNALTYSVTTGQAVTLSNVTTALAAINIAGNTPTSLDLNVNKVGSATVADTVDLTGTAVATLNLKGVTAASTFTLANTGAKLATINFSGDQNVKLDTALATITTINGATATGGLDINSIGASNLTFTGGAGNDRLNFVATLTASDKADGGSGTDTIAFGTAGGATLTTATGAGIKGFEILEASGAASGVYDVDTLITNNSFTGIVVSATTSATVNNINSAAVGNIKLTNASTGGLVFTAKDFVAGGSSDTATITLDNSIAKTATGIDVGTSLTFANADILNIVTKSDGTAAKTIASGNDHSIAALTATDLEKIVVTGDESVEIALAATTTLTEFDASGLTGLAAAKLTTGAAVSQILAKGTANVDTIALANAATTSSTLYTGGGSDVISGNASATAVNTLKFTTTALNAGDLKAGDAVAITLANGAAGGQVIIDFNSTLEGLLKSGGTTLSSAASNVTIQGTSLGTTTNVASSVAAVGGADVTTIQFDLNGDGTYTASSDAQITITITGVAGANDTFIYNAANDNFVFTVV